ncbi:MAG: hypothetical protein ACRDHP_03915, partial [Ktedonobacterales bacterium]
GAVSAALPLDTVLAPTVQLSVMLLLVGALLALVSLASGTWIYGARVESVLDRLDGRLNRLADAAADVEHLAHAQVDRSSRQSSVARQIAEQVRALDSMAQVMEQGHAALRDSTTEIWAEISQPGLAPDIALATRLAQQTAVASARVGSAAEDARDLCRQLVAQMNHIAAAAGMVTDGGHALEQRAQDLRACVEGVEVTLGERLRKRMVGSSLPLIRQVRAASQHLRWLLPAWAVPVTDLHAGVPPEESLHTPPTTTTAQPPENRHPGSLWDWQDASASREPVQQRPPVVDPSFGAWLNSTGHHATPPRISGTLHVGSLRPANSGDLPPAPRDSSRRGDPAASLPHSPRSSRYPYDTGSSDAKPDPYGNLNRSHISGWLDE